jgi:uncharacterized protein (DUF1330 family)
MAGRSYSHENAIRRGLALLGGLLLGAVLVKGLHAEPKPPVYLIVEIDVTDLDGYSQYLPLAQASLKEHGGRIVAGGEGQGIRTFEGTPPKSRVVIAAWDSLAQIEGWLNSAKYEETARSATNTRHSACLLSGERRSDAVQRAASPRVRALSLVLLEGGGRFLRPCVQPSIYGLFSQPECSAVW